MIHFHKQVVFYLSIVSLAMVCGFVPMKKHTHDTLVRSCTTFQHCRGWDNGMRQWFLRTQSRGHKPSFFSTALSSSSSASIQLEGESAKQVSTDALWSRLEKAAEKALESSSTGGFFTRKQVGQQDPTILNLLEAKAGVSFEISTTFLGLIKSYLTKGAGGFIVFSMLVTFLYRMSLVSVYPLGVVDVLCFIGTRIFWEAQEWVIHSRWFHGGDNIG